MTAPNLDLIFRALSDGTRRLLIHSLVHALARGEPLSARELALQLGSTARGISRHLKELEGAGLIGRGGNGSVSRYHLQEKVLQLAGAWIARQETLRVQALNVLDQRLSEAARLDHPWRGSPEPSNW